MLDALQPRQLRLMYQWRRIHRRWKHRCSRLALINKSNFGMIRLVVVVGSTLPRGISLYVMRQRTEQPNACSVPTAGAYDRDTILQAQSAYHAKARREIAAGRRLQKVPRAITKSEAEKKKMASHTATATEQALGLAAADDAESDRRRRTARHRAQQPMAVARSPLPRGARA